MIDFSKILFLDIETVSQEKTYDQLNERMQKLWDKKAKSSTKPTPTTAPPSMPNSARLYASRWDSSTATDSV